MTTSGKSGVILWFFFFFFALLDLVANLFFFN